MNTLNQIPNWFIWLGIIWSTFQGARGVAEQRLNHNRQEHFDSITKDNAILKWKSRDKWIILYVHDFVFRFICTITGFIAIFIVYSIIGDKTQLQNLSPGASALVIFLSIIGIVGIGGQLHYLILMGKWPK